ncbi:hypothetical protein D0C36_19030 [Mucilaginibacter conchicola]|uniref:Uncharacterized protein n=1 Tax=Mucilaginibacter conchicola TaxID=2303333 RepID=A0A372NQ98_9SPHI|nr:hypothetical protein [Mucilaginibacter conchicola]RFZ91038.1 hypothetical protein D0C36_19030 [Mucilaginibacter conchicola]
MGNTNFNEHLQRLKAQTETLKETLAAFRDNYSRLQFGMHRMENEIKKSREMFEELTNRKQAAVTVIQMNTKQDDDIQLTA